MLSDSRSLKTSCSTSPGSFPPSRSALLFAANVAQAAANHVVISEFATRPDGRHGRVRRLYNPTNAPVDISGWKLQYKSATGTTWNDRGCCPRTRSSRRTATLIANQSYIGAVTPDFSSGAWNSGTGMADNGQRAHHRRVVQRGGSRRLGHGDRVEGHGRAEPRHVWRTTCPSSARRSRTSNADSLFTGGARAARKRPGHEREQRGLRRADARPQSRRTRAADRAGVRLRRQRHRPRRGLAHGRLRRPRASTLTFSFAQDSSQTLTKLSIAIPPTWMWVALARLGLAAGRGSLGDRERERRHR